MTGTQATSDGSTSYDCLTVTQSVTQPGVANSEMYLHRRANGVYYFRRRVPSDLEGIIQPGQFHYSLGTRKRQEALKPYAVALARSEHEIEQAREKINTAAEKGRPVVRLSRIERRQLAAEKAKKKRARVFSQYTEREIDFLVSRWFEEGRRETERYYRDVFVLNSPEEREGVLRDLGLEEQSLMGVDWEMNRLLISREVSAILDDEDCEAPRDWLNNPQFRRFYGLVLEGLLQFNKIAVSLVESGKMPPQFQRLAAFVPQGGAPIAVMSNGGTVNGPSITLDELIERFEKEPRRQSLREDTRKEYKHIYRALREQIGGEKLLQAITRDDVKAVAEMFLHLPARATLKAPKRRLLDLAEEAKAKGAPLAHVKTYNKRVSSISAIFTYAVTENLIAHHLAKGLSLPEPPRSGEDKAYSIDQLNIIFSGDFFLRFKEEGREDQFTPNHPERPCYFWAPLIGLFHGMRSGEILQIKTANIFEKDGVPVFKTEGEVKNHRAYRIVPLHPQLIQLGFLTYVDSVRRAGYDYIFPDAINATTGKLSSWYQKPYARYLTRIGIKTGRDECFHAFRHTWNGGLRRADIPQEIRRALGGWVHDKSAELGYGPQHYPRLLKYLERLEYPGLELKHLYPKRISPER